MSPNVNSVKTGRSYHHGALRPALLRAAEALIAERGVEGFSLREAARRAGVSPAAPAHHFGDARGLLTALAAEAFREFGDALEQADGAIDPADRAGRIRAQGRAYVGFALANRAKFDLMWRSALLDKSNPHFKAAADRAFGILDTSVRGQGAPGDGSMDVRFAPSIAAWSLVHGFVRLAIDGAFGLDEGAAEQAAETMLPAMLEHLSV